MSNTGKLVVGTKKFQETVPGLSLLLDNDRNPFKSQLRVGNLTMEPATKPEMKAYTYPEPSQPKARLSLALAIIKAFHKPDRRRDRHESTATYVVTVSELL